MTGLRASAVAFAVAGLLTGCVAAVIGNAPHSGTAADARARAPADTDAGISRAVRSRFGADAVLNQAPIEVSAYRGTVTLRGTVASAAQRSSAEQAAHAVAGVAAVNNQLKVR